MYNRFGKIGSFGPRVRNIWFLSPLVPSKREKNIQTENNLACLSLDLGKENTVRF